jgi:hypothetical protein
MNRLEELRRRHDAADQGGGPDRRARQRKEVHRDGVIDKPLLLLLFELGKGLAAK